MSCKTYLVYERQGVMLRPLADFSTTSALEALSAFREIYADFYADVVALPLSAGDIALEPAHD